MRLLAAPVRADIVAEAQVAMSALFTARRLATLALAALAMSAPAGVAAQTLASVQGVVRDATDAVIVEVDVTLNKKQRRELLIEITPDVFYLPSVPATTAIVTPHRLRPAGSVMRPVSLNVPGSRM